MIFIIITLILFIYIELYRLHKTYKFNIILFLLLIVSFSQWYVVPILLSECGYWTFFEGMLGISIEKYNYYACLELVYYAIILSFTRIFKRFSINRKYIIENRKQTSINKIIIIVYCMIIIYGILKGNDYDQLNDIQNSQQGMILSLLIGLISYYILANILFVNGKKSKLYIILASSTSILSVLRGVRIYILSLVWIYIACAYKYLREKRYIKFFTPIVIGLFGSLLIVPIIAEKRTGGDISSVPINVAVKAGLFHVNLKLNSIAYGSVLPEKDGIGFAGVTPYIGSFFKFVPRAVWPDKPTPLSYNGEIEGTPSRRIPRLVTTSDNLDTANTGYSPLAISLWQGSLFVLLSLILNVIYLRSIIGCIANNSYWIKAIGLYLFTFPQLDRFPSTGDNIVQKLLEAIFLIVLLLCLRLIKIKRVRTSNRIIM